MNIKSFILHTLIKEYLPFNIEERLFRGEKILLRDALFNKFELIMSVIVIVILFGFYQPSADLFIIPTPFWFLIGFFLFNYIQKFVYIWLNTTYLTKDGLLQKNTLYAWNEIISMKLSQGDNPYYSMNTRKGVITLDNLKHTFFTEPLIIKWADLEEVPRGSLHDAFTSIRWQKRGTHYQEFDAQERMVSFLSHILPDKYETILTKIILIFGIPVFFLFQYLIMYWSNR